jgi:hypothetical protein
MPIKKVDGTPIKQVDGSFILFVGEILTFAKKKLSLMLSRAFRFE